MTRSGNDHLPTVSAALADNTLVELTHDRALGTTMLAVREPGRLTELRSAYTGCDGIERAPYSATNNLLTSGCILLPSAVGDVLTTEALIEAMRAYLSRYVQFAPSFELVAAYFVLLTWVYDAFAETPYLRLQGDYGTGKTRGLLAIGSICYKPFFASGASTVSPIFHILDAFQGTLILDEADLRFSDATAELTKILNNGTTRGLPVLRTMTTRNKELMPTAFRVFGPKVIAMREHFEDQALESRFLTGTMESAGLRADIPLHLPDALGEDAQKLRNQLLAWRFANRHSVAIDPSRALAGVEPRTNQMALPLLALVHDEQTRGTISRYIAGNHGRLQQGRAESEPGRVLCALVEELAHAPRGASVGNVADRLNKNREHFERILTSRAVGSIVRTKLHLSTVKTHGTYIVPASENARLVALCARYGVEMTIPRTSTMFTDTDISTPSAGPQSARG